MSSPFDDNILQRYNRSPVPYDCVDHTHNWHERSTGDAYCPICGWWRSQIEKMYE